ncbi:TKL/DICTY4 protein kinase [Salpingoeca rosetta]|uniref:guanylate cyclase n=1 Tax=Salpingoeca rosetta (strain ATCC 50818 / BSB-021) TaxID=946362 RepID=F2UGJ5_SALR5|nr:TKL/DICTY4 protein kinase [Salpingoeca rosetta]EGD75745.1 TKL/DICTY4 protein kinase [Salpingoeca rosetta]|eukprot:XP_004991666.1 TKL/DICTY4 protein kinase [Salpingoeca rosetta]
MCESRSLSVLCLLCQPLVLSPSLVLSAHRAYAHATFSSFSPVTDVCDTFEELLHEYAPWNFTIHRMTELEMLDNANDLDFALADTKTMACLDVERGHSPLATLGFPDTYLPEVDEEDDFVYGAGGVTFALRNSGIVSLSDLKDQVVAGTTITDFASTHANFAKYHGKTGRHLIDDATVLQFMGTQERVLEAVLSGAAAAGMVQTGFLEHSASAGLLDWDDVDILAQEIAFDEDGTRFPYFSSTPVYPGWTLVATHLTSLEERDQLLDALFDTDSSQCRLSVPGSFATAGGILETFGVVERDLVHTTEARCVRRMSHIVVHEEGEDDEHGHDEADAEEEQEVIAEAAHDDHSDETQHQEAEPGTVILAQDTGATPGDDEHAHESGLHAAQVICPATHFHHNEIVLPALCADVHCPGNTRCMCRPCLESPPILIHPVPHGVTQEVLEANPDLARQVFQKSCQRMEECATGTQGQVFFFILEDRLAERRHNADTLFFVVRVSWPGGDEYTTEAQPVDGHAGLALINVTEPHFGAPTIAIYEADRTTSAENWEPIYASPLLLQVEPRSCPPGQEATQDNTCVCPVGTLHISGSCMQAKEYLPIFIGSALAVIGIGVYIAIAMVRRGADKLWQIDAADVVVSDPPEVLGMGAFGVVIKGELNGTAIAIKRVMPRASRAGARGTRTGSKRGFLSSMKRSSKNGECDDALAAPDGTVTGTYQASRTANGFGLQLGNMDNEAAIERALEQGNATTQGTTHRMSKTKRLTNAKAEFMEEMRLLSRLRHPCIATMLGAIMTKSREFLLVMEHLEHGSLYDFLRNDELPTPDIFLLPIVKDIVSGMRYIHNLKPPVVHGDLKTKNVLVDGNFKAKVADFGLSQKQRFGCGTPFWMAPEVLRGGEVTREADVYSFAITVYEIYSRQDPFPEEDASEVLRQIAARQVPAKRPDIPASCPVMLAELARRCWSEEPKFRPTFDQVDAQLGELNISKVGASLIQQKQDALKKATVLHDVFPPHIAKMLEEGKKVHPEHKDDVTIFFSDIVGFTNISAQLTPAAVSDMLDRLYSAFDELTEKHGVFKVETIGDAYMAATNLVKPQHDHALRIAQFAEDAIKAAQSTFIDPERPELGCVNIRVGFHCGPVVANVVGRRNPRYCLFGDTVNTASRMESSSERNKIHVSTSAGDRVRSQAPWVKLESRGVQNIKGKGEMLTYWLVSTRKPEQTGRVAIAENEATVIDMGEGDGDVDGDDDGDGDTGSRRKSAQLKDSVGGGFVFKKKRASSIGRRSTGAHEGGASARVSLSSVSWLNDAEAFEALSRDSFGSPRTSTALHHHGPRSPTRANVAEGDVTVDHDTETLPASDTGSAQPDAGSVADAYSEESSLLSIQPNPQVSRENAPSFSSCSLRDSQSDHGLGCSGTSLLCAAPFQNEELPMLAEADEAGRASQC